MKVVATGEEIRMPKGDTVKGRLLNVVGKAIDGIGEYEVIFIPWYWQEEYQCDPPPDFKLSAEDLQYQKQVPDMIQSTHHIV